VQCFPVYSSLKYIACAHWHLLQKGGHSWKHSWKASFGVVLRPAVAPYRMSSIVTKHWLTSPIFSPGKSQKLHEVSCGEYAGCSMSAVCFPSRICCPPIAMWLEGGGHCCHIGSILSHSISSVVWLSELPVVIHVRYLLHSQRLWWLSAGWHPSVPVLLQLFLLFAEVNL